VSTATVSEPLVTDGVREDEETKVESWRAHVLCRAGVPAERALELAQNPRVDVRLVERLLVEGATL
jgi:hypothetical protein